jgi:CheY-like chemotaxis protein
MGSEARGKTFLVIEDSSDDALLIKRAFRGLESCQAIVCRNLSEARAYMNGAGQYSDRAKYPFPNAVICDLHLGYESGVDFVLWIKEQPTFKDMPVIILTGTATTSEAIAAKEKGALDVLRKPARYEDLKVMLDDLAAKLCS